jgi:hypothetical protein
MFLADTGMKNDKEPIPISAFADLTKEPHEHVLEALNAMTLKGILSLPAGFKWAQIGGVTIDQIRISLSVTNMASEETDGQKKMDLDPIPAPTLTPEQKRDQARRQGLEKVEIDGWTYTASVYSKKVGASDGSAYWALDVYQEGAKTSKMLVVEDPQQFALAQDAWLYFDEWLEGQKLVVSVTPVPIDKETETQISEWVDGFDCEEQGIVYLDFETFRALYPESFKGPMDWLFGDGTKGFVEFSEDQEGARWPGFDPQPEPEAEAAAAVQGIYEWACELPMTEDSQRLVDAETFDKLVASIYDGFLDQDDNVTAYQNDLRDGIVSTGPFMFTRGDAGARWPGLIALEPEPAVEEEEVSREDPNEYSIFLEDQTPVKVKIDDQRRGRMGMRIVLLGELNRDGNIQVDVTKKQYKDDLRAWITAHAEEARLAYLAEFKGAEA